MAMTFEEPAVGLDACKLISQGAEARVFEVQFLGKQVVLKQRFSKKYRLGVLDTKITVNRLKQEVRGLLRARKLGVRTPVLYFVEHEASAIYMEKVAGHSVKHLLLQDELDPAQVDVLLANIGQLIATLHDGGLVHGDLTTSNLMVTDADAELVLIDFGLSQNSTLPEDKSVDLYVLERAFTSAHSTSGGLFDKILESYKKHSRMWSATMNRFAEVRMRGRKRAMVG